jgi:potassium/hydrogen antiporter
VAIGLDPSDPLVAFGVFAGLVLVGFLGNAAFAYLRLNDTLLLMLLGLVLGPGLGLVSGEAMRPVSRVVGPLALVLILFDGGLGLRFRDLLHGVGSALALAFLGFGFTVGAVGAALVLAAGLDWLPALTFGAIVGGTSSVIVMSSLAYIRSTRKTDTALAVESAITDILVVVAVFAMVKVATAGATPTALGVAGQVGGLFGASLALGTAGGFLWLLVLPAVRDRPFGYMLTLAWVFIVYIAAEVLLRPISSGGGPLAVLALGIVLGNAASFGRWGQAQVGDGFGNGLKRFQSELAFLVRTFFFIALGILVDPALLADAAVLGTGLAIFAALAIARYLAVGLTVRNPGLGAEGWVMLLMLPRGLAAAVMAGVPLAAGMAGTEDFVAYAFIVVGLTNLVATIGGFVLGGPKPVEKQATSFVTPGRAGLVVARQRPPKDPPGAPGARLPRLPR